MSPLDLSFESGSHVCQIYETFAQQKEVILPFLSEGLRNEELLSPGSERHTPGTTGVWSCRRMESMFSARKVGAHSFWPPVLNGAETVL